MLDSVLRVLVIGFVVLWMAVTAFFVLRTLLFLMTLLLAGGRQLLDSLRQWRMGRCLASGRDSVRVPDETSGREQGARA